MVYRFDADYNGQVVAESLDPASRAADEPFLGLHYPATDIPAQARQLYLTNWLRVIPDLDYTPVPLVPEQNDIAAAHRPHDSMHGRLDLGHTSLRSVSPLHVEYLKNMGVTATMTVSLLDLSGGRGATVGTADHPPGPRLWGLVACHHYSGTKHVPYGVRAACEIVGEVASMQISTRLSSLAKGRVAEQRGTLNTMLAEAAAVPPEQAAASLVRGHATLPDLIESGGAALCLGGNMELVGDCPDRATIRRVATWACEQATANGRRVVQTDRLPEVLEDEDLAAKAAGVLAVPIREGRTDGDALLWFRPEVVQTVTWAGNPAKAVEGERLSPRKSFAAWQERLRGRSLPWTDGDVATARELRAALLDVVLRRTDELEHVNQQLAASNEELDNFAYAAGHDLREPLRGMFNLASFIKEDYGDRLDEEGQSMVGQMQKLARRMDSLVGSLLDYARLGNTDLRLAPVNLNEVVAELTASMQTQLDAAGGRVVVPAPLPTVCGDEIRLMEILQNLISNGLKYSRREVKTIEIGCDETRSEAMADRVAIYVRDDGIGIDPRHRSEVFRIFRRLHGREAFGGGSGAGLTIVKRAVERHGGRIWIEENPNLRGDSAGEGTTFWFTLPR